MAKRTRRVSRTKQIEQSLRDAQGVLASYIQSGGKQVKGTLDALLKIFDGHQFASALKSPRRAAVKRTTARRRKPARATRSVKRKVASSPRVTRRRKSS
jgi:hypothetical protein